MFYLMKIPSKHLIKQKSYKNFHYQDYINLKKCQCKLMTHFLIIYNYKFQKMNDSSKHSIIKRIKDIKNRAQLFNYILKDTRIFKEPFVSVLVFLQGIYQVVIALFVLSGSLLLNPFDESSSGQIFENDVLHLFMSLQSILQENQIIIQPLILGTLVLFCALHFIDLAQGSEKQIGSLRSFN